MIFTSFRNTANTRSHPFEHILSQRHKHAVKHTDREQNKCVFVLDCFRSNILRFRIHQSGSDDCADRILIQSCSCTSVHWFTVLSVGVSRTQNPLDFDFVQIDNPHWIGNDRCLSVVLARKTSEITRKMPKQLANYSGPFGQWRNEIIKFDQTTIQLFLFRVDFTEKYFIHLWLTFWQHSHCVGSVLICVYVCVCVMRINLWIRNGNKSIQLSFPLKHSWRPQTIEIFTIEYFIGQMVRTNRWKTISIFQNERELSGIFLRSLVTTLQTASNWSPRQTERTLRQVIYWIIEITIMPNGSAKRDQFQWKSINFRSVFEIKRTDRHSIRCNSVIVKIWLWIDSLREVSITAQANGHNSFID